MNVLHIPHIGGGGKYLGLPEQFGRRKKEMFSYVRDNVKKVTQGWQNGFLSPAGKETLIKSVAFSMPVYSMTCFKLPQELCNDIDSLLSTFWWGSSSTRRKMPWVSWKKLSRSKRQGGLGFRDLHLFNQALLANHVWRILERPSSLIYRLLKSRYFRTTHMLAATAGPRTSFGWQSLQFGCELLINGTIFAIGNGLSTCLGLDKWLPTVPPRPPILTPGTNPSLLVASLINPVTHQWNEQALQQYVDPTDHHHILKIFLPPFNTSDTYLWSQCTDGFYTTRSGYHFAASNQPMPMERSPPLADHPNFAASLWTISVMPKVKHFLWRVGSKAIATADNLRHRGIRASRFCRRCNTADESTDHVLFTCQYAQSVWHESDLPIDFLSHEVSIVDKLSSLIEFSRQAYVNTDNLSLPFYILWRLWKVRNEFLFNDVLLTPLESLRGAQMDAHEWLSSQPECPSPPPAPLNRHIQWSPPPPGWVKCNYDVSHRSDALHSGLGWIVRNSSGVVLHCGYSKFHGRYTIEEAECSALIWAIQASWGLAYRNVAFEGDNQYINRVLNSHQTPLRLQHYLNTIRRWIPAFEDVTFGFQVREANTCADVLALKAIESPLYWFLFDSCPPFILSYVTNDCMSHFVHSTPFMAD